MPSTRFWNPYPYQVSISAECMILSMVQSWLSVVKFSACIEVHYFHNHRELYITGDQDHWHSRKCSSRRQSAKDRAEVMADLALPVTWAWNYVTSRISRVVSHHSDLKPWSRLSQIAYLLTSWQRRRVGDYGYLEAIDIMEEEKEYWEARAGLHQRARLLEVWV